MLDVGRRTWIERNGNTLISMFCLTPRHSGWRNIIHSGITSGMFDDIFAQYCYLEAPELFALTKGLHIDFVKPAFSDEVLLARVSKTTSLARSEDPRKRNKKLWVEGHINAVRDDEIVTLAIAKHFSYYASNFLSSVGHSIEGIQRAEFAIIQLSFLN